MLQDTDIKPLMMTESPLKVYLASLLSNNMDNLIQEHGEIIEEVEHFFFENLGSYGKDKKLPAISSMEEFLKRVIEDNIITDVKENLISLVKLKLLEVYNLEVLLSGIRLLYRLRKEAIFEHLNQYSNVSKDIISIAFEIDILFSEIEEYTFQVLTKYSRERIGILKDQLFETQKTVESLSESNKELNQVIDSLTKAH